MSIQLQIEPNTRCNAACVFCPYPAIAEERGETHVMPMALFQKILDEAATIPQITQVCITGLSETLLDPHIVERVAYARRAKPKAFIDVFTNGTPLTPARFDALKRAGVSGISVSLNAANAEQHERQMGLKGQYDRVCSNIEYAIAHRDDFGVPVLILVKGVFSSDVFTEEDVDSFYTKWGHRDMGGHGSLVTEGNWAGDNRLTAERASRFKPNEGCFRALQQVYVTAEGRVTTCCFDPTGKQTFGDLTSQTIREVYNSEPYVAFREAHAMDRADRYSLCAGCTRI